MATPAPNPASLARAAVRGQNSTPTPHDQRRRRATRPPLDPRARARSCATRRQDPLPASEISRDTSPLRLTPASPFRRHALDHAKPMEDPSDDDRPTHHPPGRNPFYLTLGLACRGGVACVVSRLL